MMSSLREIFRVRVTAHDPDLCKAFDVSNCTVTHTPTVPVNVPNLRHGKAQDASDATQLLGTRTAC